jgi:hypothetical protein
MKEKINIAEILKDKPQGTKLYSSACGKCKLEEVDDKSFKISFYNSKFDFMNGGEGYLDKNGKLYDDGECVVFPSKEMRDWSKFAWKKGDVLVSNDGGTEVIFDKWYDDTYTNFYSKHYLNSEDENNIKYNEAFLCTTERYSLEDKDTAQTYINTIEERLGGKLNRGTLVVEKPHSEFKDGDVLFVKCKGSTFIEIFNYSKKNGDLYDHVSLDIVSQDLDISGEYKIFKENIVEIRLATEEEKQQLFSALEKEGKRWDAEKKQIVDLMPNVELKPFDKVLVRDSKSDNWCANLFGYIDKDEYYHCVYANWVYCIPYAGNEHLLGTTKDVEG